MSEMVQRVCPVCGATFEVAPKSKRVYCSQKCRDASENARRDNTLRHLRELNLKESREAKRRRDQMLKHRDAEFAKIGVRVLVAQGEGVRVERRGMVGGGCCVGSATGFNPRPFDLRLFKP